MSPWLARTYSWLQLLIVRLKLVQVTHNLHNNAHFKRCIHASEELDLCTLMPTFKALVYSWKGIHPSTVCTHNFYIMPIYILTSALYVACLFPRKILQTWANSDQGRPLIWYCYHNHHRRCHVAHVREKRNQGPRSNWIPLHICYDY